MMLPTSTNRVKNATSEEVNRQIREDTKTRIRAASSSQRQIDHRLKELEREWDTERFLEMNASALALAGTTLALTVNKRFAYVPLVVGAFMFQHAIQGWCPPLPIIRRMGFRTPEEIDEERYALKLLRGDFEEAERQRSPEAAYSAVTH